MKLELLFEASKVEYVIKTFGEKLVAAARKVESGNPEELTPEAITAKLETADPTGNKEYLVWLALQYVRGSFRLEDTSRLRNDLEKFHKIKKTLENKDIMKYDMDALYNAIESGEENPVLTKGEMERSVKSQGSEKIIDEPNFTVLELKSKEAACFYGKGTKWCTAADENNMFDSYAKSGKMYFILVNDDGKQRKFQLHFNSGQFMNERDVPLSAAEIAMLSKFPGYKKFLNMLVDHHYKTAFADHM